MATLSVADTAPALSGAEQAAAAAFAGASVEAEVASTTQQGSSLLATSNVGDATADHISALQLMMGATAAETSASSESSAALASLIANYHASQPVADTVSSTHASSSHAAEVAPATAEQAGAVSTIVAIAEAGGAVAQVVGVVSLSVVIAEVLTAGEATQLLLSSSLTLVEVGLAEDLNNISVAYFDTITGTVSLIDIVSADLNVVIDVSNLRNVVAVSAESRGLLVMADFRKLVAGEEGRGVIVDKESRKASQVSDNRSFIIRD